MADQGRAADGATRFHRSDLRGDLDVFVGGSPDPDKEVADSVRFTDGLLANGVQEWRSRYRWLGPVKVMAYKEVGPPPWRWPKVGVGRLGRCVRVIVGWRSTAYSLVLLWTGRRPSDISPDDIGADDDPKSVRLGAVTDGSPPRSP